MIALSFGLGVFCWQNCCHNIMLQKNISLALPVLRKVIKAIASTLLNSPIHNLDATKSEPVGNLIGVDPKGKYKWYTQNQVIP
jgi:hypothetical protein